MSDERTLQGGLRLLVFEVCYLILRSMSSTSIMQLLFSPFLSFPLPLSLLFPMNLSKPKLGRRFLIYCLVMGFLHELQHAVTLWVLHTKKRARSVEEMVVELRGRPIEETSRNEGGWKDEDCVICLGAGVDDPSATSSRAADLSASNGSPGPMETFCLSGIGSHAAHRRCFLSWWRAKQHQRRNFTAEEIFGPRIPFLDLGAGRLISLEGFSAFDLPRHRTRVNPLSGIWSIGRVDTIQPVGEDVRIGPSNAVQTDFDHRAQACEQAFTKFIEEKKGEGGVHLGLSASFLALRGGIGSQWWRRLDRTELDEVRREEQSSFILDCPCATVVAADPGPTCPVCRQAVEIRVHSVQTKDEHGADSWHHTRLFAMTRSFRRRCAEFLGLWSDCMGPPSLLQKILLHAFFAACVHASSLGQARRQSRSMSRHLRTQRA